MSRVWNVKERWGCGDATAILRWRGPVAAFPAILAIRIQRGTGRRLGVLSECWAQVL